MEFVRRLFRRRESHVRFWGGRLSVGFHALCLGAAGVFLVWNSWAVGLESSVVILAVVYFSPLGIWWFIRLAGWSGSGVKDETRGWFFAPGLVAAAVLISASGLPTFVRFSMSRDEFDQRVQIFEQTSDDYLDWQQPIGSFDVEDVTRSSGRYFFRTQGNGYFLDPPAGFAYLPYGPTPEQEVKYSFRSVGGDWYSWK